jgi:hypothetical protein
MVYLVLMGGAGATGVLKHTVACAAQMKRGVEYGGVKGQGRTPKVA